MTDTLMMFTVYGLHRYQAGTNVNNSQSEIRAKAADR